MKRNLKAALAGAVTLAFAGGGLLALTAPAFAAGTAPPWESDPDAATPYANIALFDSAGNQVTGGSFATNPDPFAWAASTTPVPGGDTSTKAIFTFTSPVHGQVPSTWTDQVTESATTTFSPASGLPAATPADVKAFAPSYVVVQSTANLQAWIAGGHSSDTTTGYNDTVQVRMYDTLIQGTTTYWETDIGFCPTAATTACSVDGNNIQPGNWLQLFPFFTSVQPTLQTSATGGQLNSGNNITLTATLPSGATGDAGGINFYDGSTLLANVTQSGGTAAFTTTTPPANGTHTYTASFIAGPPPGDPSNNNSTTTSMVTGTTSAPQNVNVSPPKTNTTTTITSVSCTTNCPLGQAVNFAAQVAATDNGTTNAGEQGTVQFFDGATAISTALTTTVNASAPFTGTVNFSDSTLPSGNNSITAAFSPTNSTGYNGSTSPATNVNVATATACQQTGSVCSDTQNITATINPGTITISTPYTSQNPFNLGVMVLSSDGTFFETGTASNPGVQFPKAGDQPITVTSSLAPAYAWTLSVAASPLTGAHNGGTIPASGLGLTNGTLINSSGAGAYPGSVTFTGIPALNPSPVDGPGTGPGLSSTPQKFAGSNAADGTAEMQGTLTLFAATSTPADTYSGTVTFSIS